MSCKTCCCGCCSVRAGTRAIAVACMILAPTLVVLWVSVTNSDELPIKFAILNQTGWKSVREFMARLFLVVCVFSIAEFAVSLSLLRGTIKDDEFRCTPWLYFNVGIFAMAIFLCTYVMVIWIMYHGLWSGGLILGVALGVPLAVGRYCLHVVLNYILELRAASVELYLIHCAL